MKKIIAVFVLMLGFGVTASAQQKAAAKPAKATTATSNEAAIQQAAIKDVKALAAVVPLDNQKMQDMKGLFEHKHRTLSENLGAERNKILAQTIEAKLNASLTPEEVAKIKANPELLKQLTH